MLALNRCCTQEAAAADAFVRFLSLKSRVSSARKAGLDPAG
jgi:hypothetical protein